jgi:capsid portal protein
MKLNQNFSVVNMAQQDIPVVTEDTKTRYSWVPVGISGHDDYFASITEGYNTSTTNAASIEGIADMIFGKGIYSKNTAFQPMLDVVLPQEEIKRVSFDIKLYGNGAFQVYWNDEHTKIVRMYHIPVQTLRAEKIYDNPRIENYYYCTDWTDQRKIRDKKKIPAFGTSNEKMEILYIKNYTPGQYYYSLPDWFSALQFSYVEAELSNLHINNIQNGFLPMVMINMNNGIPAPEERDTIEDLIQSKFTGTRNAGRFILTFNDDKERQPTIEAVQIDNLHEKFKYVAEYAQDRILVAHRVTSPLLFGIRTANNGFSSQSEEMKTAYSILQTMTIIPFQNLIINALTSALAVGGYSDTELYFEQMTPLVILSQTAEETGQSVEEVQQDINDEAENPAVMEDGGAGVIDPNMDNAPLKASRPAQFGTPEFIKEFR